jgi:hypothetical protein
MDAYWSAKIMQAALGAGGAAIGFFVIVGITKLFNVSKTASDTAKRYGCIIFALMAVQANGALSAFLNPDADIKRATEALNASSEKMISEAKPENGKTASEVMAEKSRASSVELLSKMPKSEQTEAAADQFFGFFIVNTRIRPEYCSALGVQIPSFVKEFTAVNQKSLDVARTVEAKNAQWDEEKIYRMIRPSMIKNIDFMMKDEAIKLNMNDKELCAAYESQAVSAAQGFRFADLMPVPAKLLTNHDASSPR